VKINTSSDFKYANEGFSCLEIIINYYDKNFSISEFREMVESEVANGALLAISDVAERIGFRARWMELTDEQLIKQVNTPCILYWRDGRFIVKGPGKNTKRTRKVNCIDPSAGSLQVDVDDLLAGWATRLNGAGKMVGAVMILEPGFKFWSWKKGEVSKFSWRRVGQYFHGKYSLISGIVLAFIITSIAQLIFPFLVQSVVDVGIKRKDYNFITLVLSAQVMMVFGRMSVDFIRARLLMQISGAASLSIISDFWIKLSKLSISYFERTRRGDVLQRVQDSRKMLVFMTGPMLNTFFSSLNFVVLSIVLIMHKLDLFLVFIAGMVIYLTWTKLLFGGRKKVNQQLFDASAVDNNSTLQMVAGMEEIKLNNIEQPKRWEWEDVQVDLFRASLRNLNYGQLQQTGGIMINNIKDVVLLFLVARYVIQGQLTFGAMLAIQYITGQLSAFIDQFIGFFISLQDAKISMDRLNEVHLLEDEENEVDRNLLRMLPYKKDIRLKSLSFAYPGENDEAILNNIDLIIPEGKTTAIVGGSGSGKTTLLKLLLKFYDSYRGNILIGDTDFRDLSPAYWRSQCAAVLQDGFIFSDTIANNIALEYEGPDHDRLIKACKNANVLSFIEDLPNGFNTRIGPQGTGISQGQKQRLLIARAIYKNAHYWFLDESTNALDANNERVIISNMSKVLRGKTVVIVAHRMSTIKDAHQIIVMDRGCIVEQGSHFELSNLKGRYYDLLSNQLDMVW
jgi:ATP-binding cassette subfamily B protein